MRIAVCSCLLAAASLLVSLTGSARAGPALAVTPAMKADVARLVAAAKRLDTAWPWRGAIPQVEQVARHGVAVAPALVAELRFRSAEQWGADGWNLHVEQQVELALCKIFGVEPRPGRTVFGVRSADTQNEQVLQFWRDRVSRGWSDPRPAVRSGWSTMDASGMSRPC